MDGMLATGRVQSPHGVEGYLKVESFSGETRHLLKLRTVVLESRGRAEQFDVERTRKAGASVLIKLKGIDTPERGRRLSNATIWVERKKAAKRRRKEFYAGDLTDCDVVHGVATVGRVKAVCTTDSGDFLEISNTSGETFLLPFNARYFGKVDLKRRTVAIIEDWLLE